MTAAPNITRTVGGRYFISGVPPTFVNADEAMRVHADIVRRIGHIEHAHEQAEEAADKKAKP